MSSLYSHEKARQSIQENLRRYEAIALSMAISFELQDFMEERGIKKQELAEAAGISPSYLSQVFSGNRLINIKMLAGISQKYDVRFGFHIQDAKVEKLKEFAENIENIPIINKATVSDSCGFINNQDFGHILKVSGSDCESKA